MNFFFNYLRLKAKESSEAKQKYRKLSISKADRLTQVLVVWFAGKNSQLKKLFIMIMQLAKSMGWLTMNAT